MRKPWPPHRSKFLYAECVEKSRESPEALGLKTLLDGCFEKPKGHHGKGHGPRPHGGHGKMDKRGPGAGEHGAPAMPSEEPGSPDHDAMPPPPPQEGFDEPEMGPGPRHEHHGEADEAHGQPDGKGPGRRPPHMRLPPKEAARFDTDECKAALTAVAGIAG